MPKWAVRFLIELLKLVIAILEDLVANGNGDFVEATEEQAREIVTRRAVETGPSCLSVFSRVPAGDKKSGASPTVSGA